MWPAAFTAAVCVYVGLACIYSIPRLLLTLSPSGSQSLPPSFVSSVPLSTAEPETGRSVSWRLDNPATLKLRPMHPEKNNPKTMLKFARKDVSHLPASFVTSVSLSTAEPETVRSVSWRLHNPTTLKLQFLTSEKTMRNSHGKMSVVCRPASSQVSPCLQLCQRLLGMFHGG